MVSNCNTHSRREAYVAEMRKYVDVDVYGRCGQLNCTKDAEHKTDCARVRVRLLH